MEALRAGSNVLAASLLVKAARGMLVGVVFTNTNAATRYLQLFDSASIPADSAVPLMSIQVAAGASYVLSFAPYAMPFFAGIAISNSSTAAAKTIGAADSLITALYL